MTTQITINIRPEHRDMLDGFLTNPKVCHPQTESTLIQWMIEGSFERKYGRDALDTILAKHGL